MGQYTGIKKPLPCPAISRLSRYAILSKCTFHALECEQFKYCCAIDIICDFPDQLGGIKSRDVWGKNTIKVSKDMDISCLVVFVNQLIEESRRGYLMVAINDEQEKAGIGDVLVEYLGFSLLDDPFTNPVHSNRTRVSVYGLCKSKYVPFE